MFQQILFLTEKVVRIKKMMNQPLLIIMGEQN